MILYEEGATQAQRDEAHWILDALTVAYPGHPWAVKVYDGGFFIRHLEFPANWGMNGKHKSSAYSASALKRDVIRMAGEWLERANLKRGRSNEDPIKHVEGVPDKWQPPEWQEQQAQRKFDIVVAEAKEALRTQPRPQATRGAAENGD